LTSIPRRGFLSLESQTLSAEAQLPIPVEPQLRHA